MLKVRRGGSFKAIYGNVLDESSNENGVRVI
jgi:hypothetical protein